MALAWHGTHAGSPHVAFFHIAFFQIVTKLFSITHQTTIKTLIILMSTNCTDLHEQSAARTAIEALCDKDLRVPYFCEENVWRLCYRKMREQPESHFFAVFISNGKQCVPMFHQIAASDPEKPCCWDYHVILLGMSPNKEIYVYDVDSLLPYPTLLRNYIDLSFINDDKPSHSHFAPMFRVVPGKVLIREFSSDRSHMFHAKTSSWNAPPPPYDCINMNKDKPSTFHLFRDFSTQGARKQGPSKYGVMLTKQQLMQYEFIGNKDKE